MKFIFIFTRKVKKKDTFQFIFGQIFRKSPSLGWEAIPGASGVGILGSLVKLTADAGYDLALDFSESIAGRNNYSGLEFPIGLGFMFHTVFYRVFFYYFERFLREYDDLFEKEYGYFRPVIQDVVEKYLDCGNPMCGFASTRCPDCGEEQLLYFSCKTHGFCPSCHSKRLEEIFEHAQMLTIEDTDIRGKPTEYYIYRAQHFMAAR